MSLGGGLTSSDVSRIKGALEDHRRSLIGLTRAVQGLVDVMSAQLLVNKQLLDLMRPRDTNLESIFKGGSIYAEGGEAEERAGEEGSLPESGKGTGVGSPGPRQGAESETKST